MDINIHRLRHLNVSVLTNEGVSPLVLGKTRGMSQKVLDSIYLENLCTKKANETFRSLLT